MDAVTIGAVLAAISTGAGEGLGNQLWDGVVSLVRRPLHHKPATNSDVAAVVPTGEAHLAALQQAPGDQDKAVALAEVLLARSIADEEFRRAVQDWWDQAGPIRASIENVTNTVSGGTQHGPVLMGRDFSNVSFGVAQASPPPVPPILRSGVPGMVDVGGGDARSTISGGTQHGPVLMGRDFRNVHIGNIVQAAAAPVALAQLPALVTGFTGREAELAEITALLDPAGGKGAVVVSAVAGLAGVGKTALAVRAAHAARELGWFPGGVLFIDLHGYDNAPVGPGQALDALLRALEG